VNPNNYLPLNMTGPNITATNTIHIGADRPSSLVLPVVDISDLPPVNILDAARSWLASKEPETQEALLRIVKEMEEEGGRRPMPSF
jgi:hypothetical protein